MKLLDIYSMMERNEITEEEAAQSLGMPVKVLKFRVTRLGLKLPLYLAIFDKIKEDKITRSEAAEALQVSVRGVKTAGKALCNALGRPETP